MEYNIREIAGILNVGYERLKETAISILLTDSRRLSIPEESLFFALKTRSDDGHKYIRDLYNLKVRNFVVQEGFTGFSAMPDANFLVVKNTLNALQRVAAYHRKRFSIPVIGITGSNGKTVVKEFLYQLLNQDFNIVRSPRSYNSQIGVPLSIWQMNERHTLGIFEAGISTPDEMEKLQPIIAPTVGILTSIGEAHQENFYSLNEKCLEKLMLFKNCEAIIYDADNPIISHNVESACLSHKSIAWSRTDSEAPLFIESIRKEESHTVITCTMLGMSNKYTIPFTDDASIENVIHCLALMLYLKPTGTNKSDKFRYLEPVDMRMDIKQGINKCILINDTYNSDLNSLEIALDFLVNRSTGGNWKKTLILSDIMQSGTLPRALYKKVADLLRRKGIERIIGVGRDLVENAGYFDIEKAFFMKTDELLNSPEIQQFNHEMILIKGSRHFHFERVTEKLEKKVHETVFEVDLNAILHNLNYFRSRLLPETKVICMVKAFGYGAGSHELAKTLQNNHCDYLAVAVADEGEDLRKKGIHIPLIVMNPELSALNMLFDNYLEPEVYSFRMLDALIRESGRRGITNYPVHIKIDTGMHRLGFKPDDVDEVCRRLLSQTGLMVRSVFSHLSGSDSHEFDAFTRQQYEQLTASADRMESLLEYHFLRHLLNSAGIERFPEYQLDMVRLGIGLYGISTEESRQLQNVSTLKTIILQIQEVPAGDSVGYSRKSFVGRDSRIAIIPIGYADGLDRHLGNGKGSVLINGNLCPIIGNVCMDISMVDVTDIEAGEGDAVIIFGKDLPVSRIAAQLDTIPYEVLTAVSPRVKRVYYSE